MEKLFVETKYTGKIELPKELITELPKKVMIAATVQFVGHLNEIKKKLEAYDKEVYFFKSMHGRMLGQILGCDSFKVRPGVEGFLYIGDGEFHPQALLVNELPVFYYNPFTKEDGKYGRKEREEIELKKKVALMKFGSAQRIGIIISTKEGQREMQGKAEELKRKLESEGKKAYLFLGDEVRGKDLENFNFIESWVNTACPRISDDLKGIVNLRDLV